MTVEIGYELLADRANVTVTSETAAATHTVENSYDWLPFDYWQIDAAIATPAILFTATAVQPCDYAAIFGHDLVASTDTWKVQYSDNGSAWSDAFAYTSIISGVNFKSWTASSHKYWRVMFQRDAGATTFAPIVSCVALGSMLDVGKGAQTTFTPPLSAGVKSVTSISVDGTFLGRSITDIAEDMSLSFRNVTPAWVRASWMPFFEHAKAKPFFVSWDETNYPEDAAFCWVASETGLPLPSHSDPIWMEASVKMKATP